MPQSGSTRLSVEASGSEGQERQLIRRKPRKLTALLRRKIEAKLRQMRWSLEQISGWLREQGIQLGDERIYQMIWQAKREVCGAVCRGALNAITNALARTPDAA